MKCPKCGYISFDYNTRCPKCNKDIAAEQEKLNFPPFKPNPPFLLESLIGEATDSAPALHVRQTKQTDSNAGSSPNEPTFSDKNASGEIQEINIASYGPNESREQGFGELELPSDSSSPNINLNQSNDEISLDFGDQNDSSSKSSTGIDDMALDLDQTSDEFAEIDNTGELNLDFDKSSTPKTNGKDMDFKLDDFSLDEAEKHQTGIKKPKASQKLNLNDISSDIDFDDDDLSIDLENLDLDLDLDTSDSEK
ncbi:MAG: hypothetical protein EHM45_10420 [Desulfobacteraceae bacterium]|nr:MAG: hypothetical protein EHM45_10420 [Desulfobacteraceae bacterium]